MCGTRSAGDVIASERGSSIYEYLTGNSFFLWWYHQLWYTKKVLPPTREAKTDYRPKKLISSQTIQWFFHRPPPTRTQAAHRSIKLVSYQTIQWFFMGRRPQESKTPRPEKMSSFAVSLMPQFRHRLISNKCCLSPTEPPKFRQADVHSRDTSGPT